MSAKHANKPVMSEKRKATLFKKGDPRINRNGTKGVQTKMTRKKVALMAMTGMMPLDFQMFVMRDQLYTDYDAKEVAGVLTFTPKDGAKKETVTLTQRLMAANSAAPYVHKRMPIAIEGGDKPLTVIDAGKLATLSATELEALLKVLEKLGVSSEFAGVTTPNAGKL